MSNKLYFKHLEGFTTTEGYWSGIDCVTLAKEVLDITKAKTMLEIGFNIGYSASTWLQEGIDNLYIIDINNHKHTLSALNATKEHYKDKNIQWWLLDSKSKEAHDIVLPTIDIAFIDGEHSFAGITNDCNLALNAGASWLVIDDYLHRGVNGIVEVIDDLVEKNVLQIVKKYPMTWIGQAEVVLCKVVK